MEFVDILLKRIEGETELKKPKCAYLFLERENRKSIGSAH